MLSTQERLTPQELQRRYNVVRAGMKEKGLEVLLVSGVRFVAAVGYLRYLTNWAEPFGGEVLIVPLEGPPVFLARTGERALLMKQYLGMEALTGSTGAQAAQVLARMGCKRVGLCSTRTMFAEFYMQLTTGLPEVEFVEASSILDEARWIKSEEELTWVKKSAELTDLAFQVFSSLLRQGRSEADVFLEVEHAVRQRGAENTYFMMSADPKPVAKFFDLASDTYESGDVVLFNAEISGPGGYYTQLERTFYLGTPTKEVEAAYAACLAVQDKAKAMLRPGSKTNDIHRTIVAAIEKSGHKMGLHPGHSQGLDIFERPLVDANEKVELAPNMIIVLHPHVLLPSGGGVWIGETFLVTENGPVALQTSDRGLRAIGGA